MTSLPVIRKLAEKTLADAGITDAPVRLSRLAEYYVFQIQEIDWPDKYEGRLERRARLICVNKDHGRTKKRFTIAHEFGHYFLHHDIEIFVDDETLDPFDEREKEANKFAAELLMPKEWIKRDYKLMQDVKSLERKYEVSAQAMWIRLMELRLVK